VNWLQFVSASLSLQGALNLGKHSGCHFKSVEQKRIFTSPGCGLACRTQDAHSLCHRASTHPRRTWTLLLQPIISLLTPWAFLEDVGKVCFLLASVMVTFQSVSEQLCYNIGLVSQTHWILPVWFYELLRAEFTYIAPDLISIHTCFFSWDSVS